MKPRNRPQQVTAPPKREIKNTSEVARIEEVLAKVGRRVELAAGIGVSEGRISEYIAGKRLPTPEAWIKLGKLALEHGLPDPFYFWAKAGLDPESLGLMLNKVVEGRYLLMGETAPIPRFRVTDHGKEPAGPPVPLPVEFVPNPLATICLSVDIEWPGMVDSPKRVFIVDTSCEGAQDLSALWERVVMVRYAGDSGRTLPRGLYSGRLFLNMESTRVFQDPQNPRISGWLGGLFRHGSISAWLGEYIDAEGMRGIKPDDKEGRAIRWEEIQARARSEFRMRDGMTILGKVVGRLTGGLGVAEAKDAGRQE
jgi:hypothetical protein